MRELCRSFFFILLITSCYSGNNNSDSQKDQDSLEIQILDVSSTGDFTPLISPKELFKEIDYIRLESPDTLQLTVAYKILELRDKLIVLDGNKKALFAYDLKGKFIGQVGKKGGGPGEYRQVSDFDIDYDKRQIVLYARADKAIFWFDEELKFVERKRIDAWGNQLSILESGSIAIYSYMDSKDDPFNIRIYDKSGNLIGKNMSFPQEDGQLAVPDFSGFIRGNYFTYPYSSVIYRINEDQSTEFPVFEVEFPNRMAEEKRFDHMGFLNGRFAEHILGKFEMGKSGSEALFYYSKKTKTSYAFTLGVSLANGQVFGHRQLKHGEKGKDDIYVMLFFRGPYSLPTYSASSGYFYVARNLESVSFFYKDILERREELKTSDRKLYDLLDQIEDLEDPIIMKFKLVDSYEKGNSN